MYIAILNSTRGGGISLPLPSTDDPALSDTSLRALSRGCRDLKLLFLAGCSRVSDKGLLDLKKLKHLHVLNLADCSRQANRMSQQQLYGWAVRLLLMVCQQRFFEERERDRRTVDHCFSDLVY